MRQLTLNQAVVSVALVALLPISVFGFLQSLASRDFARELISERLVSSALSTAAAQRGPFALARRLLTSSANEPDIRNATDRCGALIARNLQDQHAIVSMGRSSANGLLECSALPYKKPFSNADRAWWKEGVKSRGLTFSALTTGRITGRRIIIAILPLYQKDGSFDGAMTAGIDASWLEQALTRRKFSADASVAIVDANGKPEITSGGRAIADFDLAKSTGRVATATDSDGSIWLYSSAPLVDKQLHIVYAERQAPLLAPLRDQFLTSAVLPLLAVLATCLAVWFAMNQFVIRWLRSLSRLAGKIAKGDYDSNPAQFDRAPQEIASLGDDMREMARAINERDAALRISADQNHAMAREVNHRVKNNLQMVMSLLELQTSQITDDDARRALNQTRMRINAIALIHRVLYDFGESSEHGDVDMDRLIGEICTQLRSANIGPVALECHSTIGIISVDTAMPISLFAVEAVTNAYRHAFTTGQPGAISVSLSGDAQRGQLCITDNGGGFRSEAPQNAMGLQLMEAYASQLNGSFQTGPAPDGGVMVELSYESRARTAV